MLTVVSEMGSLGYWWSYRILCAQYFGLAQRRKRVFIVGCLGDGRRAAEVLLEPESLCGDPAPSRETGAGVAQCLSPSITGRSDSSGGKHGVKPINLVAATLNSGGHEGGFRTEPGEHLVATFEQNSMSGRGTLGYDEDAKVSKQVQWASGGGQLENDTAQALRAGEEHNYQFLRTQMTVRRLTPVECCRLQGFPDTWLDVEYKGKPLSDSARYRMLGNAVAVPCAKWIGHRMMELI